MLDFAGMPHSPVIFVLLALLAVLPYGNALQNGFAFDDEPVIQRNPVVTDGVDLTRILASPVPPGDLYRPLTVLTFAVNERLSPGRAASFHAVNLLLHAAVTLLVFAIAVRLFASARVAAIAAALFAVHPIHTEAVTNIVGRAELLAALFGLLALVCAADADAGGPRQRRALQFASLASFSLAVLSKESALTVLPLTEEGRPATFSGAVGTFALQVTAGPTEVTAGDPVTVRMLLNGSGNLSDASPPALTDTGGFRMSRASASAVAT